MSTSSHICQPETVLFIGAGASAKLNMPTTDEQAGIFYHLCDQETVSEDQITAECFKERKPAIIALLTLLDYPGNSIHEFSAEQKRHFAVAFPGLSEEAAMARTVQLRCVFDWPALKAVCRKLKSEKREYDANGNEKIPENFQQNVFDLIDVLLREQRGMNMVQNSQAFFLGRERLLAARECLILLVNTMFACAWQDLVATSEGQDALRPYRAFADVLAELMEDEALNLERQGIPLHRRAFYLFSYSILTTNFEPIFLWLIYQAHKKRNKTNPARIGHPGKKLQLMLDFPNTLGMHTLADNDSEIPGLKRDISFPFTEAVVQKINDECHVSDRVARVGKYYFVHGSSNFRHCPRCGRLNLFLGDCWDENTTTLYPPGVIEPFAWSVQARTDAERETRKHGEYDALECLFCGQMTYAQHNFMHMQTHFKGQSPSFLKEITDEALAGVTGARHVVLLGYRFPTDDTIWTSNFRAMLAGSMDKTVFCSVVVGHKGPDKWLYGAELKEYRRAHDVKEDGFGTEAIENAIRIFGEEQVRAYTGGIPQAFHNGDKETIREMLYPTAATWPDVPEIFDSSGIRRGML